MPAKKTDHRFDSLGFAGGDVSPGTASASSSAEPRKPLPGDADWLKEHGISREVYEAQGIERYSPENFTPVEREFAQCAPNQIKWARNQALKTGNGLVMRKHTIPGLGLLPNPPQLRPDTAQVEEEGPHHHPLTPTDEPRNPRTGKPLAPEECWTAWEMRRHILGAKGHHPEALAAAARRGFDTRKKIVDLIDDHTKKDLVREILEEAAASFELPHYTLSERKYLLTIGPEKPWIHDHASKYADDPDALREHLKNHHSDQRNGGERVTGRHDHSDTRPEIPDHDPRRNPGKRINMNPLAWKRLAAAEFVFFGIEGTIKSCAMLSSIIEADLPATAFDVPSIGQWAADELKAFLPSLMGKKVFIVPDADGRDNPQVMNQARLLQARLGYLGLAREMIRIAAPPDDRDETGSLKWKGVDDFLGVDKHGHKGNILDLQWVGEGLPLVCNLPHWKMDHAKKHRRKDALERDYRVFEGLIRLAGPTGKIQTSLKSVARFINESDDSIRLGFRNPMSEDAIERAVKHLLPDWIETDIPLSVRRWTFKTPHYSNRDLDWAEGQPTILIKDSGLRAFAVETAPIRDFVGRGESAVREDVAPAA